MSCQNSTQFPVASAAPDTSGFGARNSDSCNAIDVAPCRPPRESSGLEEQQRLQILTAGDRPYSMLLMKCRLFECLQLAFCSSECHSSKSLNPDADVQHQSMSQCRKSQTGTRIHHGIP